MGSHRIRGLRGGPGVGLSLAPPPGGARPVLVLILILDGVCEMSALCGTAGAGGR